MKYFLDTEFIDGSQTTKTWWGKTKKTKPTIDIISIGIVDENGLEYYAISKDFNLKEAWRRFDYKIMETKNGVYKGKEYWIRENVLLPIYKELLPEENRKRSNLGISALPIEMNYKDLKYLISVYGKTNICISNEIKEFIAYNQDKDLHPCDYASMNARGIYKFTNVEFYAYFADYDWVAFCWLFGKMIDLPKGFPKYCKDLKQMLDEKIESLPWMYERDICSNMRKSIYTIGTIPPQSDDRLATMDEKLKATKEFKEYPKQTNEHNALADAKWNLGLYKFLQLF